MADNMHPNTRRHLLDVHSTALHSSPSIQQLIKAQRHNTAKLKGSSSLTNMFTAIFNKPSSSGGEDNARSSSTSGLKPPSLPTGKLNAAFPWMASKLKISNLPQLTNPDDIVAALNQSLDTRTEEYFAASLELVTRFCEKDHDANLKKMIYQHEVGQSIEADTNVVTFQAIPMPYRAVELGACGACNVLDQILGLHISDNPTSNENKTLSSMLGISSSRTSEKTLATATAATCEACFRAICSLISLPVELSSLEPAASKEVLDGIAKNAKKFGTTNAAFRIVRAALRFINDEFVLEWALRTIFYLSLIDKGIDQIIV